MEWVVDSEISLHLVDHRFIACYSQLVRDNREYLSQWLAWPLSCVTEQDFMAFVEASQQSYYADAGMSCSILYKGEVVGNCGFNQINHSLSVAEIGYWIAEAYQGQGIVTRSCQFLIRYAFTQLNLNKVQISVAEGNVASRAVCERLGMRLEGVITNSERIGERVLAHAIYGLHSETA